jgi:hypothetical protein
MALFTTKITSKLLILFASLLDSVDDLSCLQMNKLSTQFPKQQPVLMLQSSQIQVFPQPKEVKIYDTCVYVNVLTLSIYMSWRLEYIS